MKYLEAQKTETKVELFVCPHCGEEYESLMRGEEGYSCYKCKKIMAKTSDEIGKLPIIEKTVNAYICPNCNVVVPDTPLNHGSLDTISGNPIVLCPICINALNGLPVIHHGMEETFEIIPTQTDYFWFWHKPCRNEKNHGYCEIYAVLIDNAGRVIFNLRCLDCNLSLIHI